MPLCAFDQKPENKGESIVIVWQEMESLHLTGSGKPLAIPDPLPQATQDRNLGKLSLLEGSDNFERIRHG
jgi:hypothetical protein